MKEEKINYTAKILVIYILIFMISIVSSATMPKSNDLYVNDYAKVLGDNNTRIIREAYRIIEENTTAEVVFVSMETIDDEISSYATRLGQEWGVGKEDKDNGIVILYVKDINKIWVAVGYGIEGILPDSKIGRMLDENYVPYKDNKEVSEGITQFSIALGEELIINREEILSGKRKKNNESYLPIILFLVVWVIMIVITSKSKKRLGFLPIFIPGSFGGRSGGGFGGGSFGGGGFGGGGAGR